MVHDSCDWQVCLARKSAALLSSRKIRVIFTHNNRCKCKYRAIRCSIFQLPLDVFWRIGKMVKASSSSQIWWNPFCKHKSNPSTTAANSAKKIIIRKHLNIKKVGDSIRKNPTLKYNFLWRLCIWFVLFSVKYYFYLVPINFLLHFFISFYIWIYQYTSYIR